jgi:hypothetical protein
VSGARLSVADRAELAAVVDDFGEVATARALGVARGTIIRALAERGVRRGTLGQLRGARARVAAMRCSQVDNRATSRRCGLDVSLVGEDGQGARCS